MVFERNRRSRLEKTALFLLQMLACALLHAVTSPVITHAQVMAGTSVYVRQDTDRTTVIAPRLHVGAPVDDRTRVDLVYTADVWTSASVDIRASASKPVTEQRDEIDATVSHEWEDLSLSGTYRYSHEYDYESHGASLTGAYSFADKAATLDFRLSAAFDDVGRAGDPNFDRNVRNLAARVGITQLLDRQTFVQVLYEIMDSHGFNSSAYRFIALGSPNGLCAVGLDAPKGSTLSPRPAFCFPETLPIDRLKHAFALNFRRALGEQFSVGLGYRFFIDSWGVMSHTGLLELGYLVDPQLLIALRYRFYQQGDSKYYKRLFESDDINLNYYTNDKEMSSFMSHRLALDIEKSFELDKPGHLLTVVMSVAPSLFLYSDFAPLTSIRAIEVTLATVLKL
jgi:hypothetical protein